MEKIADELKKRLTENIRKNPAEGLLFSGGLDTSLLAAINPRVKAITVSLQSYGEDKRYSDRVAKFLNLKHYKKDVNIDEAIDAIPEVIRALKSFDPAIPNDLVVYFGLRFAKKLGIKEIMTGDGADELFAGYDFMRNIEDLDKYIRRIASSLVFNSNELGNFFGIGIKQPYLDRKFIDFALNVPLKLKIKEKDGKIRGKWILRKAFEELLPPEIIWQNKRTLECGSGMTRLRQILSLKIPDEEFEEKKKLYPIRFLNKEHLYYYEIYKREVGEIPGPKEDQKGCPGCGAGMSKRSFHCKVCGYVI